jgi:arginase
VWRTRLTRSAPPGSRAARRTHPVRVEVPPYNPVRDPETTILNSQELAVLASRMAAAVAATLDGRRFPLVLGGYCSLLLGPLLALRRRGRYGLAFIDCHADFWHPRDEPIGEAASLRDTAITIIDLPRIRELGAVASVEHAASTLTRPELDGFWIHFDVDVLDDELMPAVDYHQPGGLSWAEAESILGSLLALPGAAGLEVTIFNPRLDPDGALARKLTDLLTRGSR